MTNPKEKYHQGQAVIVKGTGLGIIDDTEYENDEWTYRVVLNELGDFGWFGEDELTTDCIETIKDIEAQD